MHTLIIDTSYGSTVGIVGHEPVTEHDSRTHVERLQADIDRACAGAGVAPHDIERIVVGTGPAPFTGLRAGIVAAKAIAFATGAELLGQDDLTPSAALMHAAHRHDPRLEGLLPLTRIEPLHDDPTAMVLTLAVNDARRKQLYFALYADDGANEGAPTTLIDMDIDRPEHIARRVRGAMASLRRRHPDTRLIVDVVGHGADAYEEHWRALDGLGAVLGRTALDLGAYGLDLFADLAQRGAPADGNPRPVEPLYLRRPDVSVPNPLKHVLNHAPARADDPTGGAA